jgi:hypothetical protein
MRRANMLISDGVARGALPWYINPQYGGGEGQCTAMKAIE